MKTELIPEIEFLADKKEFSYKEIERLEKCMLSIGSANNAKELKKYYPTVFNKGWSRLLKEYSQEACKLRHQREMSEIFKNLK